jgi:hypothetical protein
MTTRAQIEYDNAKHAWFGHHEGCSKCNKVDESRAGTLVNLCWQGTQLFKTYMSAKQASEKPKKKASG